MTQLAPDRAQPLHRWHPVMFVVGALLVVSPSLLHAYLLMPFPGSQDLEAIKAAYHLERALAPLAVVGSLLLVSPVAAVIRRGSWVRRIALALFVVGVGGVAYATRVEFSAQQMFREPTTLSFAPPERSAIPLDAVVLGVEQGGAARAYPIDLIAYHHKVHDTLGGQPILVTYCTMCRTGRVYSAVVDGAPQRFRLVGARHYNAVLEDEQSGTWWYQGSGKAAVGPREGQRLTEVAYTQATLRAWITSHPETTVLQPDPAFTREYAGLVGYDRRRPPAQGEVDPRWTRRSWVLGVEIGDAAKAWAWDDLVSRRVLNDAVAGVPIVLVVKGDAASFYAHRREIDGEVLELSLDEGADTMTDARTGARWSAEGECLSGPLAGRRLTPVQAHQEYWHSWQVFHPGTQTWSAAP